jgi:methanogenic corrinoid protein MtbC1
MVGGAPVSRALAEEIGADGFADDCILAVDEAERLMAARHEGGAP